MGYSILKKSDNNTRQDESDNAKKAQQVFIIILEVLAIIIILPISNFFLNLFLENNRLWITIIVYFLYYGILFYIALLNTPTFLASLIFYILTPLSSLLNIIKPNWLIAYNILQFVDLTLITSLLSFGIQKIFLSN